MFFDKKTVNMVSFQKTQKTKDYQLFKNISESSEGCKNEK